MDASRESTLVTRVLKLPRYGDLESHMHMANTHSDWLTEFPARFGLPIEF
jgi:hypothetical protein